MLLLIGNGNRGIIVVIDVNDYRSGWRVLCLLQRCHTLTHLVMVVINLCFCLLSRETGITGFPKLLLLLSLLMLLALMTPVCVYTTLLLLLLHG